jgi:hypothetical protein
MTPRQIAFYNYLTVSEDIMYVYRLRYASMISANYSERDLLESLDLFVPDCYMEIV